MSVRPDGMARERMSYSDLVAKLRDTDAVHLMRVQGVATRHEAILLLEEGYQRIIYAVSPDGGPVEWLREWAATPRDFEMWSLPDPSVDEDGFDSKTGEILHYVVDRAQDEVRAER